MDSVTHYVNFAYDTLYGGRNGQVNNVKSIQFFNHLSSAYLASYRQLNRIFGYYSTLINFNGGVYNAINHSNSFSSRSYQ